MPYSSRGPIEIREGKRAVTLFEIDDLVTLANKKNKDVVIVAGPCPAADCNRTRSEALQPLLRNHKELGVWSHLYMDMQAAKQLVDDAA
jgi:hypothetical protein